MSRRRGRRGGRRIRRVAPIDNEMPINNPRVVTEDMNGILLIARQNSLELSHHEAVVVLGTMWTDNKLSTRNPDVYLLPGLFTEAACNVKQVIRNGMSSRFRHTKVVLPVNCTVRASKWNVINALTEVLEGLSSPPPSYVVRVIHGDLAISNSIELTVRNLVSRIFPHAIEDNAAAKMLVAVTTSGSMSFITVIKNPHRYNMLRLGEQPAELRATVAAPVRPDPVQAPILGIGQIEDLQIETNRNHIPMESETCYNFFWRMPLNSVVQTGKELQANGPVFTSGMEVIQEDVTTLPENQQARGPLRIEKCVALQRRISI